MTARSDAMNALALFVGVWNTTGRIRAREGEAAQRLMATGV